MSLAKNAAELGGKLWREQGHAHYYFPQYALNWFAGISYQGDGGGPCYRGQQITPIQARRLRAALWKVAVSAEPDKRGRVSATGSCRGTHRAKLIRSLLATATEMREIAQGRASLLLRIDAGVPAGISDWPCDVKSVF
ncbi:hypothetical protein ACFWVU_28395 [Streptomyces sp. NPDC058686]|uniref:hypothetical protein n=1 Tax=Streptomyces sp. NPDC058686 TaxID=3346599 RepID=UPI00364E5EFE